MPITSYYKPEAQLIIFVHTGKVQDDEFFNYYKSMIERDLFTKATNLLIDLRQTDSSPRSPDVLRKFADFVKSKLTDASTHPKVAVVAPNDLSFGFARMYEFFADAIPWNFVVFRSVDTALAWLRIPEEIMNDLTQQMIPPDNNGATSGAS